MQQVLYDARQVKLIKDSLFDSSTSVGRFVDLQTNDFKVLEMRPSKDSVIQELHLFIVKNPSILRFVEKLSLPVKKEVV